MRILIVGASRGTGALAVRAALDNGHSVTAFARNPGKLTLEDPRLKKLTGDFHQASSVGSAVPNHDAVIVTASATRLRAFKENPTYFSQGTGYVIDAMKKASVRRLVVLSALGAGDSRPLLGGIIGTLMRDFILKRPFDDHDRQEALVRASGLDWVIARPTRLTDGKATGAYQKTTALARVPGSIHRADVAKFLVEACESPAWVGHAVQLGG